MNGPNSFNLMKKRNSSNSSEPLAHPNVLNYLALIHAVTHPGNRPEPTKQLRSLRHSAAFAIAS